MPTITVYGATSYTAMNHLLPYLLAHNDAGSFNVIIAGRSQDKLDPLATKLVESVPGSKRPDVFAVHLEDTKGVRALVDRSDVVINLAGPYSIHNAVALVDACVRAGKHYLDLSGELHWIARDVVQAYDFEANKTGSVVVSLCGFESVPGDLTIYAGLRTLQDTFGRDVGFAESTNFYAIKGGYSGGTMRSVGVVAELEEKDDASEWSLTATSVHGPITPPQLVYRPPKRIPGAPTLGAFYAGSPVNVAAYRRSWYLSRMSPVALSKTTNTALVVEVESEPRHGDTTVFKEALSQFGSSKITFTPMAFLISLAFMIGGWFYLTFSFVRDALAHKIPQPGEGPSMDECRTGFTRITNVSISEHENPVTVLTRYDGKWDPGYMHTGALLAESALSLVLPPPEGTRRPAVGRAGGVLTASTAFGTVLIERLRIAGVATITSEIIEGGKPVKILEAKKHL